MPSEYSVYRKIQVIIEIAQSVDVATVSELKEKIASISPPNFQTQIYDKDKDEYVPQISINSIARTLNLCIRLSLLDESGRATEEGRSASKSTQFDTIIGQRVKSVLESAGIHVDDFNDIIMRDLQSNPPILPTSKELWNASNITSSSEISYSLFSRLLTLLSQCGGAQSSQKKIFLEFY